MKFTKSQYPFVDIVVKKRMYEVQHIINKDKSPQMDFFVYKLEQNSFFTRCINNLMYITKPFNEAVAKAYNKLLRVVMDEPLDDITISVIINKTVIFYDKITINKIVKQTMIITELNGFIRTGYESVNDKYNYYINPNDQVSGDDEIKHYCERAFFTLRCLLAFKKYAQIETKVVDRINDSKIFDVTYSSKLPVSVRVASSAWFITSINTHGFPVSAHLRLQPYGNGLKRWIWIDEFQKEGYTRTAQKIKQYSNSTIK